MCSHVLSLAAYSCAHGKTADKGFFRSRMHPVVAQLTCVTAGAEVLRCLNLPDHLFHWVLGQFARGQQHHVYVHVHSRQLRWCGVRVTQFEPRGGPTPIEPNENPKYGNGLYHNMWSSICWILVNISWMALQLENNMWNFPLHVCFAVSSIPPLYAK